ncbi:MAG: site-2 protease family protein [Anaerolinea sp.]|nr:site-2 protease family protein [Anaerolinea sp.]
MLLGRSPAELFANAIALLIAMTIHEFAHNYIAYRMGDPEPARAGRLTLNPFVHINWIGWIMFALIGFGILGSAPISPYRMPAQNRRWRWLAAVAAGPLSNLILGMLIALIMRLLGIDIIDALPPMLQLILFQLVWFNILLFIFNLLPLFPIDGWQVVLSLLPPDLAVRWESWRTTTTYILFGLILLSFVGIPGLNLLSTLIGQPSSDLLINSLGFDLFRQYITVLRAFM